MLQIPAALAAVAGTVAAVSWSFRVVSFAGLAVAGTVLWLQLRLGRSWRSKRVILTVSCIVVATAGLAYSAFPRPEGGLPVQFTVGTVRGLDGTLALPSAVSLNAGQLSSLNSKNQVMDPSYAAWFASRDFAYTGQVVIEVQAQGTQDHTVRLINVAPVERCTAPMNGTLFLNPGQGEDLSAQLYLDLNDPTKPAAYMQAGATVRQPDYFGRYSISLAQGEQETFQVTAAVTGRSCQFTLAVTVLDGDQAVTETISDHGRPFRVTSLEGYASYQDLYLGGVISEQITKGQANQYQDSLWIKADPKTYEQGRAG